MSSFATDSQSLVAEWRRRAKAHSQAALIETRLHQAARHVEASRLGVDLYGTASAHPTAALVLVFGSGQASIDLCATALLRWHHKAPALGREWDFRELSRQVDMLPLTPAERAWYDAIVTSPHAEDLTDFRHAILHRVVRVDATVRPGWGSNTMTISPSTGAPGVEDAALVLDCVAQFVEARWRVFLRALGA